MSKKHIFLHIGPPKTATTTIQHFFDRAHDALLAHGVLYPLAGRPSEGREFRVHRPQGWRCYHGPMKSHQFLSWTLQGTVEGLSHQTCWAALLEELRDSPADRIVLSAEAFARLEPGHIRRVRDYLEGHDVLVLLYLRDPFGRTLSEYTQSVKTGRCRGSFRQFAEAHRKYINEFEDIAAQWREVFGEQGVQVRSLEGAARRGGVVPDVLRVVGLEPGDFTSCLGQPPSNPSPPPAAVRLMRLVNGIEQGLGQPSRTKGVFRKARNTLHAVYARDTGLFVRLLKRLSSPLGSPLASNADRLLIHNISRHWYPALRERCLGEEVSELDGSSMHHEVSPGGIPPDAFVLIIGAMKCGTTSLYRYLVQHPQVCPSRFKEPEFFSEHQDHRRDDITRYHDLWDFDPETHRCALEASTGYTKYPFEQGVPERILASGARPRLIYLVRNPFERIISEYEFRPTIPFPRPPSPIEDSLLLDVSNYYLQLAQYRPYFERDQLLVLDFEQLKTRPLQLMETVCGFLGLDPGLADWAFGVHLPTPRWSRFQARLNQTRLFQRLNRSHRQRAHGVLGKLLPPQSRRVLTEAERAFIHDALHDDMIRLRDEYGVDVSAWGFE